MVKILALHPHKDKKGTVARMIQTALDVAAMENPDVDYEVVHLRKWLANHEPDNTQVPQKLLPLAQKLLEADVIFLGMGVQWGAPFRVQQFFGCMTGLESGKRPALMGKVACVFAHFHEDGGDAAVSYAYSRFAHFGCAIAPNGHAWVQKGMEGQSENGWQDTAVSVALKNAIIMARLLVAAGPTEWAF